jgi:hypothetical protein
MVMYVRQEEETSCIKMVHFYEKKEDVPSEMVSNAKSESFSFIRLISAHVVLDEAFPEITIDLVRISFTPG